MLLQGQDVVYLQILDSELEDGLDAVVVVHNKVGNVSVHKELAGSASHDLVSGHAGVGAACIASAALSSCLLCSRGSPPMYTE
jgi:hypothetical protein